LYYRNEEQRLRKQNYARYKQLTEKGYSISEQTGQSPLYVINDDPFGRTYYTKPLGESVARDPITGQTYTQEEWSTKEFIIDNKTQLINKAHADLLIGKGISVTFPEDEKKETESTDVPVEEKKSELDVWLEDFLADNQFDMQMSEASLRNSSLGDQFIKLYIEEGKIKFTFVEPDIVDIEQKNNKPVSYEVAWEIEKTPDTKKIQRIDSTGDMLFNKKKQQKTQYSWIQKETYFPGKIRYELFETTAGELGRLSLNKNPDNAELIERARAGKNYKILIADDVEWNVEDEDLIYVIEEYTGIDCMNIIHWPNYRIFSLYGISEAGLIESLQNAINNRATQVNDIMDKHSDPSMYGNPAYLDNNGNITMSGAARFFPTNPGDPAPGYLEWGGHVSESMEEINRLVRAMLDNTETAQALLGLDSGGVESGRALMYKLIRSLNMRERKALYLNQFITNLIMTAQKLKLVWVDGQGYNSTEELSKEYDWGGKIIKPTIMGKSSLPTDEDAILDKILKVLKDGIIDKETALDLIMQLSLFEDVDKVAILKRLQEAEDRKAEQDRLTEEAKIPDLLKGIEDDKQAEESEEEPEPGIEE